MMRSMRAVRSAWLQAQRAAAQVEPCSNACGSPNMPLRAALSCMWQRQYADSAGAQAHRSTKSLYVLNVEGRRTLGPLLIGLMDYLERWLPNVGFFQVPWLSSHAEMTY